MPHNGHVLTRVMKDLFPRYQSMLGKRVLRKGGWDTHGLPVEVEVEKELRIHGKAAIEAYGVEPFVARCIESVFRYTAEWERLTERIGFWVSLPDAYVTFHKSYVESVWWALSNLFDKGLLYQGHKVVWWWAQGGTALSSAEVGLGYKSVDDPSVFVAFPLVDEPDTALVVWTTTPWTLPSNGYAAVRPGASYDVVRIGGPRPQQGKAPKELKTAQSQLILASDLRETVASKIGHDLEVVRTVRGEELVGKRYLPPFDTYHRDRADARVALKDGGDDAMWWRVIAEDFVTLDTGAGIVHVAPAFGEDDNKAHQKQLRRYANPDEVELICAVLPDGSFKPEAGKYAGRWVKECDKEILAELGERRLLVLRGAVPPRLPLLLALRRGSADPDGAARVVHPHHGAPGRRHGGQPGGELAARSHQRGALRRLLAQQRGLGAVARALLGHAAQRLGVPARSGAQTRAQQRGRDRAPRHRRRSSTSTKPRSSIRR